MYGRCLTQNKVHLFHYLKGDGCLTIHKKPSGLSIVLERYNSIDHRFEAIRATALKPYGSEIKDGRIVTEKGDRDDERVIRGGYWEDKTPKLVKNRIV